MTDDKTPKRKQFRRSIGRSMSGVVEEVLRSLDKKAGKP